MDCSDYSHLQRHLDDQLQDPGLALWLPPRRRHQHAPARDRRSRSLGPRFQALLLVPDRRGGAQQAPVHAQGRAHLLPAQGQAKAPRGSSFALWFVSVDADEFCDRSSTSTTSSASSTSPSSADATRSTRTTSLAGTFPFPPFFSSHLTFSPYPVTPSTLASRSSSTRRLRSSSSSRSPRNSSRASSRATTRVASPSASSPGATGSVATTRSQKWTRHAPPFRFSTPLSRPSAGSTVLLSLLALRLLEAWNFETLYRIFRRLCMWMWHSGEPGDFTLRKGEAAYSGTC